MAASEPSPQDRQAHARRHRETLARMAGQIADFFKAYPDERAVPAIADHINQFWSRSMRADFLAAFDAGSPDIHPLVRAALPAIRPGQPRP